MYYHIHTLCLPKSPPPSLTGTAAGFTPELTPDVVGEKLDYTCSNSCKCCDKISKYSAAYLRKTALKN